MAQPTSNPKLEELRFRIKTDPKSRQFYQLAEELRKASLWDESERVLRSGLQHHPTYLAAWVSLGKVLRDQHKDADAIEPLKTALQLDPGNVVAARLLGDSYLNTGEKVEAIKKYKLLLALMPGDQEVEAIVEGLEREINPIVLATVGDHEPGPGSDLGPPPAAPLETQSTTAADSSPFDEAETLAGSTTARGDIEAAPFAQAERSMDETRPQAMARKFEDSPWSEPETDHQPTVERPFASDEPLPLQSSSSTPMAPFAGSATRDDEPMRGAHSESPFEEPGYPSAALTVEHPSGMHGEEPTSGGIEGSMWSDPPPPAASEAWNDPSPFAEEQVTSEASSAWTDQPGGAPDAANVFASSDGEPAGDDDVTNTLTMADLYVRQGQPERARAIYERILEREPGNAETRSRLAAMAPSASASPEKDSGQRADKLGRWLTKVGRREA